MMDILEISDWEVLQRQPAEVTDWRLEILEQRALFEDKRRKRLEHEAKTALRERE